MAVCLAFILSACGGGGATSPATPSTMQLGAVSALFTTNGNKWNDYVAGSDWKTVADTACDAATHSACLHGGERRVVVATGKSSCTGLTAADDLGAFNWVCITNPVRMVSTGLADGKALSDLIDFATPGFKANKVTVYDNGATWGVTASSSNWWTNPVEVNNAGGSLATASTIYLVTTNPSLTYTLDADKVALVIEPSVTLKGPGTHAAVISSSSYDYFWVEGNIDASGDDIGVSLATVRFSMLRKLVANNAFGYGVYLYNSSNNALVSVTASNNGDEGIGIYNASNNNTLVGVTASNNVDEGIGLDSSSNNTLAGITTSNNYYGVYILNALNNNISGVTASNNYNGVYLDGVSTNTIAGVTASNNGGDGISLYGASSNIITGVTVSNNGTGVSGTGVYLSGASNNTLVGVTASNNASTGVYLDGASNNNTLVGVTASNNATGVALNGASNNKFTGVLKVGNNVTDCFESGGTLPGLDSTCSINGSSDVVPELGITLANSFVGKVTGNDAKNASDTSGTASFPGSPATFDWTHFANFYRGWGIDGSAAFPNTDQQGQWTAGSGRIWDWSLRVGDAIDKDVLLLPTGNDKLAHTWSGTPSTSDSAGCNAMVAGSVWNGTSSVCQTTFLRNAVEIPTDGIGNDNGLCESGETCLYTPNIGSYQGSGDLVSAGAFIPGSLIGITLMKFATNGEPAQP